ncbi:hypothetical protein TNIN_286211 [Trichonephila inaurata madagascariensis]|uniref:Uncharacterized protein n=1 Tax=Trichonephila inaurata madagascariensis TaxID=2747483 RepID=A0A8X6YP49_9ARAC|nr:hypothetical protein TNIN_286211 [Trichonephila inaurata madagascariensis]
MLLPASQANLAQRTDKRSLKSSLSVLSNRKQRRIGRLANGEAACHDFNKREKSDTWTGNNLPKMMFRDDWRKSQEIGLRQSEVERLKVPIDMNSRTCNVSAIKQ